MGGQTVRLQSPPTAAAWAAVVGKLEGEGPLGQNFDFISEDSYFGEASWEKAESAMMKQCFSLACDKGQIAPSQLDYLFAGDLLNQCTGSAFALRDSDVPFFGLYGACSTMTESLSLAAMMVDGGFADAVCAAACSHFCSSERQFRFPLEYGGQRPPTAQWTVTGAGAVILTAGGSGCGCAAATLCGYVLPRLQSGVWNRVLFAATGALMSPTSSQQGQSIPGICHAVAIETAIPAV